MLESRIIIDNSMAISLLLGLAKRIMKKTHCATFDFLGGWLYIGVEIMVGSSYNVHQNNSNEFLLCFQSSNCFATSDFMAMQKGV